MGCAGAEAPTTAQHSSAALPCLPGSPLQLLASLDSPHITRYYDSFLHDGQLVIVMEWASGGSLHAAITSSTRPLPEEVIWRVLLHMSLALHHMHSRQAVRGAAGCAGADLGTGAGAKCAAVARALKGAHPWSPVNENPGEVERACGPMGLAEPCCVRFLPLPPPLSAGACCIVMSRA